MIIRLIVINIYLKLITVYCSYLALHCVQLFFLESLKFCPSSVDENDIGAPKMENSFGAKSLSIAILEFSLLLQNISITSKIYVNKIQIQKKIN